MITTIALPVLASMPTTERKIEFLDRIKIRFSALARYTTLFTGLSGFYMVLILDAWSRFAELRYWWMYAMVIVWLFSMLILYVMEPQMPYRRVKKQTQNSPNKVFTIMQKKHWVLLGLSLVTIIGATADSHGWMLSEG